MNQGAHPMDLLTWYAGKPVRVRGDFAALNHDIETEDWAAGIVEFANGVRSLVNTTTNVAPRDDHRVFFDVHGTAGSAWLVNGEIKDTNIESLAQIGDPEFPNPIIDFLHAIKDSRPPAISVEEARWSVELINGMYESARRNRTVEL